MGNLDSSGNEFQALTRLQTIKYRQLAEGNVHTKCARSTTITLKSANEVGIQCSAIHQIQIQYLRIHITRYGTGPDDLAVVKNHPLGRALLDDDLGNRCRDLNVHTFILGGFGHCLGD